ncbi:MAG: type II toxin-antitoxin system HicA family toxin [Lachnospiraceae bacterium]|nr:type II toxin-antitoxin system HicA family toxin [Lachnospiraceae bacterium]
MNNKQIKTYKDIFSNPVKSDISWDEIESLFEALGAQISEGKGSRIRVLLNNERAVFHRPHPDRNTDKGAIISVRKFLNNAGVRV